MIEKTLSFISENGYETNHAKFLKSTAAFLAELFGVDYVLIDKYSIKSPNITETVVLYGNGCFIQNLSYNLENTPCDTVINKKLCSYPANVKHIFPKDDFLRQNNIESYIGKPLWNSKKEPLGLIALMDTKPKSLSEENNIATVFDIIGLKIEEMLEKWLFENQLNLKIKELNITKELAEENEEKYRKVSNLIFEGILISADGAAIECNDVFLKMFGYSSKEIIGKITINILFPEKYHKQIIKSRLQKNIPPYEVEGIKKDGTVFPIEIQARNVEYMNTKNCRLISFKDISSRKKEEIESRKRITAIEQSANTIVITDVHGNIEYTNPKFTEITGYTATEALGKNPRILKSGEQPKKFYKHLWQTISAGNIWEGQMKNKTKSGKFYWEHVTITPIKAETGEILSYLAIKEDVTAQKEAEENLLKATAEITKSEKKFRELFEKSGDAILIIKNGYFIDCNQAALDMLGYKNFEDVLNSHPSKLSPKLQPDGSTSFEKAEELIKITLEKGTHRFEWWHTKSNEKTFPVEVLLTTIENEINNQIIYCVWRDITKRKEAEQKLQKQNEKYKILSEDYLNQNSALKQLSNELSEKNRLLLESKDRFINLFEQNPVPLWEQDFSQVIKLLNEKKTETNDLKTYLDKNFNFVEACISNIKILNVNKAALALFGVKNTAELKIHLWKTNGKKALEVLKKELVSIGSNKKTFSDETELAGKNGIPILALIKSVIIDDYGTSIASVIDITAVRKTTNELSEQKQLFEKMFNAIHDCIIITNTDREIVMANPGVKNTFGYSPEELIGKRTEIFYADKSKFEKAGENVFNDNALNLEDDYTTYYKTKENVIFPGETFGSKLFSNQGKWIGNIGVIRNIADRVNFINELQKSKEIAEKSENSLNEAQKTAKIGSYDLDFSIGIWKSSPALDRIFGIDKAYDRNVNGWLGLVHPEDLKMMERYFEKNITENREEFNKEYRIIRNADKQILWVHGLGKIELDNQGNLKSLIGTIQDISEKRQILDDLVIAKEKAEESDRLKTEFIQNMSHEIRTPMNGILGFSELLDNPILSVEKRKHFIEIIKNSSNQLLHIIDDILEISELETKQVKVVENTVCLNDFLYELFTVFNIKVTKNETFLILKKGLSDQESTILTDKNKLNKVLSNLLENALKFTIRGTIELGYLRKGNELEIFVKDSGIGIHPEKQELIFERFSQAEKDLSKNVGGLGLGLSIAKENTELLGGKISVISKLGEGAAFFVTIPYKQVNLVHKIAKEKEKPTVNKEKYTILIAEDEEVNFMFLEILLVDKIKLTCNIIHAKDGLAAVEFCRNNPAIELVLMDIKMPKMDGHEATKLIKKFRPNLPIIAQTAYSTTEERENAILAGCNDFISKPISKDELKKVLDIHLIA